MILLDILLPMLAIVLCGNGAAWLGWLSVKQTDAMAKLVFFTLLPVFLFVNAATATFPLQLPWQYLLAYYGAVLAVYLTGVTIASRWFHFSIAEHLQW